MIDLDRIDEYCSEATEGPWVTRSAPHPDEDISKGEYMTSCLEDFLTSLMLVIPECDDAPTVDKYRVVSITGDGPTSGRNADFVAQARTDLPAVVAELREARGLLRRVAEMDPGGMTERGECGFCGQETDDWWDHFGDHYHNPGCPWVEVREFLEVTE